MAGPSPRPGRSRRPRMRARSEGRHQMRANVIETALAALLGIAMTASGASAGELIVVEARGVPLHAGQVIDDTQKLTLTEGQRVTLIAANGNTLMLRGPYDQVPTQAGDGGAD